MQNQHEGLCLTNTVVLLFTALFLNTSFTRVAEEEQQGKKRLPSAVGFFLRVAWHEPIFYL